MTLDSSPVKWSYEDLQALPDDLFRHEIIDGEHFVTPAPGSRHQRLSARLFRAIDRVVSEKALGEVFYAPLDVILSSWSVVEPDLLFVTAARSRIIGARGLTAAPDLVVEILSLSSRRTDEIRKRQLYEAFGAQEYWIVDPEIDTIKVYRLEASSLRLAAQLTSEARDRLGSPFFPGLEIALAELFAD